MVSIIIINYNGGSDTLECLRALERQTFKEFEVILIDNRSLDDSVFQINDFLKNNPLSSAVRFVSLESNRGFAGGNAEGMKHATGRYVALLNNDAMPDKAWLEELVTRMENDSEVGICASKLVQYDSSFIDSAGDGYATVLKGFKIGEGKVANNFVEQKYVFGACAGAALYRREMLEQIGFLDTDFFLIYEDTDLNFRAQLAGWKALYAPNAVVYHKVRASIGIMSEIAVYYSLRNSELVRMKAVPLEIFLRCLPEVLIDAIAEFIYFAVKHRRFKLFFKAKTDAIRMLPSMLRKRRMIMKTKKVSNSYLISIMTPARQKDFFKAKLGKFLHG
jgi:hypothetical protein